MRLEVTWPNGNYTIYSKVTDWKVQDGAVLIYGNDGLTSVIGAGQYRSVVRLVD